MKLSLLAPSILLSATFACLSTAQAGDFFQDIAASLNSRQMGTITDNATGESISWRRDLTGRMVFERSEPLARFGRPYIAGKPGEFAYPEDPEPREKANNTHPIDFADYWDAGAGRGLSTRP